MKLLKLSYSVIAYVIFLGIFNYFVLFLGGGNFAKFLPLLNEIKTVNQGPVVFAIPFVGVILANLILLVSFSLQHSVMARTGFKALLTKLVPQSAERSTFVMSTCVILGWMYLAWQPMTGVIWNIGGIAEYIILALFLMGVGLVLWATFMISHWDLFGLGQAWREFRGIQVTNETFITPAMYKYSRHPLYLGLLFVLWATPLMTTGHLMLAAVWTGYIFIGIWFEERDLIRRFGQEYRDYIARVPKLIPWAPKTSTEEKLYPLRNL